jgi:hypothetical protein
MNRNSVLLILAYLLIAGHADAAAKDIKVQNDGSVNVTMPGKIPAPTANIPKTLSPKEPKVTDYVNKNKQLNAPANAQKKYQNTKETYKPDKLKDTAKTKSIGKLKDTANQKGVADKGGLTGKIAETGIQIKDRNGK